MSSKDENENENEDDDMMKILIHSNEYDEETIIQNEKNEIIKKINDHLDEIIDKSKSFEEQIKLLKKLKNLNDYYDYNVNNFGDKDGKTWENNGIEVIVDSVNALWLNEKNIEEKLGHKNLPLITNKYKKTYKKRRYELVNNPIKQSNRRFLHIDLALKIIMDCRTDKSCSLKKN